MEPFPVFFLKNKVEIDNVFIDTDLKQNVTKHEQNKNVEYLREITKSLPSVSNILNNANNEPELREYLENYYSDNKKGYDALRNGLKVMSNTKYQTTGKAFGDGV